MKKIIGVGFAVVVMGLVPTVVAFAASSITLDANVPEGCQVAGLVVTASGVATADAPPGNLQQYGADLNWGDGNIDPIVTPPDFGNGHATSTIPYGPIYHTFNTPGNYQI